MLNFPTLAQALKALEPLVAPEGVVYLHYPREGELREHIQGKECWCNPLPLTVEDLRAYYDT